LRATTKKRSSTFWRKKVHPGDLAGGCSDLKMTWLLCCAGDATVQEDEIPGFLGFPEVLDIPDKI